MGQYPHEGKIGHTTVNIFIHYKNLLTVKGKIVHWIKP